MNDEYEKIWDVVDDNRNATPETLIGILAARGIEASEEMVELILEGSKGNQEVAVFQIMSRSQDVLSTSSLMEHVEHVLMKLPGKILETLNDKGAAFLAIDEDVAGLWVPVCIRRSPDPETNSAAGESPMGAAMYTVPLIYLSLNAA